MTRTIRILNAMAVCFIITGLFSCSKSSSGTNDLIAQPYALSYGDSILYLRNTSSDYVVNPVQQTAGTYSAFPEGLDIDPQTGAINVSRSETGLRYRVSHVSPSGDSTHSIILVSGVNYTDKFYRLTQGDSIVTPLYNGSLSRQLPSGSDFDYGHSANSNGCSMDYYNGKINLKQTIRNGAFGTTPVNGAYRDFDVSYRLNDGSGRSANKIKVRVFYYQHESDIDPALLESLRQRRLEGVFIGTAYPDFGFASNMPASSSFTGKTEQHGKDRPPCVVIIAN